MQGLSDFKGCEGVSAHLSALVVLSHRSGRNTNDTSINEVVVKLDLVGI